MGIKFLDLDKKVMVKKNKYNTFKYLSKSSDKKSNLEKMIWCRGNSLI